MRDGLSEAMFEPALTGRRHAVAVAGLPSLPTLLDANYVGARAAANLVPGLCADSCAAAGFSGLFA